MKRISLTFISLSLLLLLGACGKSGDEPAVEATSEARSILAHVPADTPYLAANLQPVPEAVLNANFNRLQPALDEMQAQMSTLKSDMDSGSSVTGDEFSDRLMMALFDELDGNLSRDGLVSLGLNLQSTSAVYGDGAFPQMRIGLSDPATLRATVLRVMENAEIEINELELQGVSYWRFVPPDQEEVEIGLYVAILADHLAAGAYPVAGEADYLPLFLGLEMPAQNNAAERLAGLNAEHGYTPYGTAFMDLHRMADELTNPEARTANLLMQAGAFEDGEFSEQCVSEMHEMIDNAPFMTAGVTELEVLSMKYSFLVEMPSSLASRLTGLVAAVPQARVLADHLAELSFGIKVGAARDFVRETARAVADAPFQCEHFQDINQQAQELLVQMEQPLPPFVNNFRGARLSIKDIEMKPGQDLPSDVRGHVAVHVDEPQMFVGMAQMFLPDLSAMNLAPGGEPSRVPEFLISVQGVEAWAAMSDEAIGMSVGAGEQNTLVEFLEMDPGPEGVFLSVDYDSAAYYDYQDAAMAGAGMSDGHDSSPAYAISHAFTATAREYSDRNHTTLSFTPKGLVIENQTTFKK
jgi:hypothetical protein